MSVNFILSEFANMHIEAPTVKMCAHNKIQNHTKTILLFFVTLPGGNMTLNQLIPSCPIYIDFLQYAEIGGVVRRTKINWERREKTKLFLHQVTGPPVFFADHVHVLYLMR